MSEILREKEDIDGEDKQSQELSTATFPADKPASRARWVTTRTELWAFYIYYIVSVSYNFLRTKSRFVFL